MTTTQAQAQFALAISPPRFELSAKPGDRVREVIELTNAAGTPSTYRTRTADWTLRPDGGVDFVDELAPGSCRPWVAIERRDIAVAPGRPYRFRFEVSPPTDAPPQECRFAIMIEGDEQKAGAATPVAVAPRIAVVVYLTLGDVAPTLSLTGSAIRKIDGRDVPVLRIANTGTAHGRLAGFLSGTDASGTQLEFQPASTPVLSNETRDIALTATRIGDTDSQVAVRFPVTVKGQLEWGSKGVIAVDQRFAQ